MEPAKEIVRPSPSGTSTPSNRCSNAAGTKPSSASASRRSSSEKAERIEPFAGARSASFRISPRATTSPAASSTIARRSTSISGSRAPSTGRRPSRGAA